MVGLCNNTDDIETVYLLTFMSIGSCYASYLDRLGYSITTFNDGNYKRGMRSHPLYNVWKRDFGHIKVSRPAEDVCTLSSSS